MREVPMFWGVHAQPSRLPTILLGLIPFIIIVSVYVLMSHKRHEENPQDKLLPPVAKMVEAAKRMAFEEDKRSGEIPLVVDTLSSLKRLGIGIGISAFVGLMLGMNMGVFRGLSVITLPVVTFISIIPPLALLPILFVSFGVGESAKIVLIIIGICPIITLNIYYYVRKIPKEQIIKSLTLGCSQIGLVYRVVLPQVTPKLIDSIRLSLGAAWLFLIAAEAIASQEGLGYRIFLVRRYMAMDVIIPYVMWITFLGYTFDLTLNLILRWRYRWYIATK